MALHVAGRAEAAGHDGALRSRLRGGRHAAGVAFGSGSAAARGAARRPGRGRACRARSRSSSFIPRTPKAGSRSPSRREELLQSIAQEEGRLARIETEQADSRRRLDALHTESASLGAEPEIRVRLPLAVEASVPRTFAENVKLFRSLFRGRLTPRWRARTARPGRCQPRAGPALPRRSSSRCRIGRRSATPGLCTS